MNQSSLADLLANYDPITSGATTNLSANAGTLSFTCTGFTGTIKVSIFVSGSNTLPASYVRPSLSYSGFPSLNYDLCMPKSGTCTATTGTIWNNTNPYNNTKVSPGVSTPIDAFSIFVGQQDVYVGSTSNYTGTLYFAFKCGSPAVAC
jgi:hypothetical protein